MKDTDRYIEKDWRVIWRTNAMIVHLLDWSAVARRAKNKVFRKTLKTLRKSSLFLIFAITKGDNPAKPNNRRRALSEKNYENQIKQVQRSTI